VKYIADYILEHIAKQAPRPNDQIRVRLSGFEDIRIYEDICRKLHASYDPSMKVETRLSEEKWNAFLNSGTSDQTCLNSMNANGWIARDTSLTFYRNLPQSEAQLIVLMGTEAVKDQGGLSDCYFIDPELIKADLGGAFHQMLPCDYGVWSTEDAAVIDRLFRDLFEFVPLNICLLSDRIDTWPAFCSLDEFVDRFLSELPEWGLCVEGLRSEIKVNRLRRAGKTNLFRQNWDFITRKSFAKLSKRKYMEMLSKPELYKADASKKYGPYWDGWTTTPFHSYDDYAQTLCEYISGKNIEQSRKKLLHVDIDVTQDILNLKLPKTTTQKKSSAVKLRGGPLVVFTQAVLTALLAEDPDTRVFDSVCIEIHSAEMADAVDPLLGQDEGQQLLNGWKQVCIHAGGVMELIAGTNFSRGGQDYSISYSPADFFSPSRAQKNIELKLVDFASGAKKLDKITFDIQRLCAGQPNGFKLQFEWEFSLDEPWCVAFPEICGAYPEWMQCEVNAMVPVVTVDNFSALMNSKSEEEYLDALEQSNFEFDCNLASLCFDRVGTGPDARAWCPCFNFLGQNFIHFCDAISKNGFYYDLSQAANGDCKTNDFLDAYQKIGEKIVSSSFTQSMQWVFDFFIHAFTIEANDNPVRTGEQNSACIIPPYHPAVLQKLLDQARFLLDGCQEWFSQQSSHSSAQKACDAVNDLCQLSQIQEGVDIFPGAGKTYFGPTHGFANYCLCGSDRDSHQKWMRTILQKDAVFDEGFSTTQYQQMNRNAQMLYDVIESYVWSLPGAANDLAIAIIDPDDLQPVIAAVHRHITLLKDKGEADAAIRVALHILVRPENKGGRNYLSYWADTFFSEDENVDVKIYQNIWNGADDLKSLLPSDLDILFLMDVLKVENLSFITDSSHKAAILSDCRFPVVYKPTPPARGYVKRRIELTQRQFSAATIHSQVVYYRDNYEQHEFKRQIAVREVSIDSARQAMIAELHRYSNWIVCIDSGMDGALLRDPQRSNLQYGIIGYSTGKGSHGQFNLTITARTSLVSAVREHVEAILRRSFHWPDDTIKKAADNCINVAKSLDGIGLLNAVNVGKFNYKRVNEFLAYILTAYQERRIWEAAGGKGLNVLVRLDSYCHWFLNQTKGEDEKNLRPDFLSIQAWVGEGGKLHLHITVIECKIASFKQRDAHFTKAAQQAASGVRELSDLFDPHSKSIRRRYWYAQLYRVLAFSQITFQSNSDDYQKMASAMRDILDGMFEIEWSPKAMLYWNDWDASSEKISQDDQNLGVEMHEIPQVMIQRLLLQDNNFAAQYTEIPPEEPSEDEQEAWREIMRAASQPTRTFPADTGQEENVPHIIDPDSLPLPTGGASAEPHRILVDLPQPEPSISEAVLDVTATGKDLADIRVNVGKDRAGNGVFWEFGNKQLANRHLLITGTSGQGKTYSIQTILKELTEAGISSAIFDYTEGFRKDQLEPEFRDALGDKLIEHIVYFEGIPIDPFRRQEIEISGRKAPEKISDVAQRIAAILTHVYDFGPQQFAAIFEACQAGMQQFGSKMSFTRFRDMLEMSKNSSAKTVLSKMGPFFGGVEFKPEQSFDWSDITQSNGTVTIFQLTSFVREIQVIITELMLWDAWHYFKKHGNKDTPFVVVLDEAQNLSMDSNSPAEIILREGRKFGWSAWFATQSLKSLSDAEIVNLHQAPFALYFKPTDDEIAKIAKQIDPAGSGSDWITTLKSLRKGQCVVVGDRIRADGTFGAVKPTVTTVTPFRERIYATTC